MKNLKIKMKNDNVKLNIIFSCVSAFFFVSFSVAKASTLFFVPQSQDIYSGETFILDARIDTEGRIVNVINGTIEYPSDKVEVVDISDGDSILSLWVEKPLYSNEKGEIGFVGGAPKGFTGEGDILKIVFRSKAGNFSAGEISFSERTKVLLNDGSGTEDRLKYIPANFEILKKSADLPKITSRTHPDQDTWHNGRDLNLHWDLLDGAEYSFLVSRDPIAEVDEIPDKPEGKLIWMGDISYDGLDDGIYYFHLRQKLPGKEWSGKVTFRAMIDATGPEKFAPEITEIEGNKYLVFNSQDTTSGVDHYEVKEEKEGSALDKLFNSADDKNFEIAASPYLLKDQDLEGHIAVKAIDKAGNETLAEIRSGERPVSIQGVIVVILIVIIFAILVRFILKKLMRRKHGEV